MKIFFDGGCHPNPGPMEAAVVIAGQAHVRTTLGRGDNNQAEWLALLFALELATAAGLQDVVLIGDSTVVVEQARGRGACGSPHLQPYLATFRERAPAIARLRLKQVPRAKNLAGIVLSRRRDPALRQSFVVSEPAV